MKIYTLNIVLIILFVCLTTQSATADTATETFDNAVASFNSGDYESALRNFQKAVGLNLNDVLKTEAFAMQSLLGKTGIMRKS